MPYTPIDDENDYWPSYSERRNPFRPRDSRTESKPQEAPVFTLDKTTFIISGTKVISGEQRLYVDGIELLPHEGQKVHNHSPDGFSWGYGGSGPAQSALAICLHIFKNKHVATALYQNFKFAYVSQWKPVGEPFRKEIDIADFLIEHRERLKIASERQRWEQQDREWMDLEDEEAQAQTVIPEQHSGNENQRTDPFNLIRVEQSQPLKFWYVGDLVTINHPGEAGVKALVYEVYDRPDGTYGISLISTDGRNLGGWEPESWKFLEYDHDTGLNYVFENVSKLACDYERGLFKPYFEIM